MANKFAGENFLLTRITRILRIFCSWRSHLRVLCASAVSLFTFEQNDDGTITALIQIQYTGFAEDFSWILLIPEAIDESAFAVPEGAMDAFTELEIAANPVFIPPALPDCAQIDMLDSAMMAEEEMESWLVWAAFCSFCSSLQVAIGLVNGINHSIVKLSFYLYHHDKIYEAIKHFWWPL